jgi:hypothetical protein
MSSQAQSAISTRSALRLSLFVLAIGALLQSAQGQTFGPSGKITVVSGYGVSASSTVSVSGISGTVTAISVTLNNVNVTGPNGGGLNSLSMALQPPSGTAFDLFGGPCNSANATFSLADTGPFGPGNLSGMPPADGISNCPSSFSGTYLPADYYANYQTPVFDNGGSGGPATFNSAGIGNSECITLGITCGSYSFTTAFNLPANGSNLNGTWTLYVANQDKTGSYTPSGSVGSWTITFTTEAAAATMTSIAASPNGSTSLVYTSSNVNGDATTPTPVTLTATVTSTSTVNAGTVTFYDSTGTSAGMGTVLASGVAVSSGVATTSVTFPGADEGPRSISAVYSGTSSFAASTSSTATVLTTNHPYNPSTGTFCNGPVTLSNTGAATPYPSLLALGTGNTQLQGTIENVTVTLNNISLTNEAQLANLGFLLQAPGSNTSGTASSGNAFQFLSWAGNPFNSGTLTFSDDGTSEIPYNMAPACTTCLPTDNWIDIGSDNPDTFPSPAPATFSTAAPTGSATFTTEFGGQGANNTWSLFADTRIVEPGAAGKIGSWCMNFTMQANAHPTMTSISGSPNPASFIPPATKGSVTLTATVTVTDSSGLTVNAGTVTFVDGTTNLGTGPVTNGVATLNTTLAEGTHQIVATYGGTNTGTEFGISTGKYDQRVDTATTIPTSGSGTGPYTYCNTGAITAPGLGADAGPAAPYPSNIFVTNLPGTVNAVSVKLTGFSTKDQGDLLSLLVGPGGNNLDFFSLTGSNVSTAPSPFNITFIDTASSLVTGNLTSAGSFKPTSFNTNITYPQCPPNATSCASPAVGPPLPSNPFTPTNKAATAGTALLGNANEAGVFGGTTSSTYNGNGTWSLYVDDGGPTGGGEASYLTGGWCVNLTQNLPSVAVTKSHTATFTQGQQGVPFTVDITNNGPGPTGDPTAGNNPLTVTDILNTAFSYASFSGTGWSCSAAAQTVSCKNDSAVAQGSSYTPLTINVNVSPTASTSTSVPNTVSVSGGGAKNTTSNTDSVTILPAPVLSVQKSHGGRFTQGQNAVWSIAVFNTASGGATYGTITVSDTLPTGYTLNSYNYVGTAVWSCSGTTTVTCTSTSGIVGGGDSIINLVVAVPANSPVSVSNTALAWGGGDLIHTSQATAAQGSDTATVIQVPASVTINNSGSPQSTTIGTAFATPLSVTVTDANSVVIPLYTVTFTASTGSNGETGTFSNSTNTIQIATSSSGVADAGTFTANNKTGSYIVTASAGSAAATFSLTNLGKSSTTFASLTTTAATIDVFGFGFTAPSGTLAFTDVSNDTPVALPVTLNTSTATTALTPQVTTSTGSTTYPVWTVLGDINGDGIPDLITSLYQTNSISVQLGNGDGTFKAATNVLIKANFGPAEAHLASLRGNGTLDLIVASFNLNEIAVLLGNGNGTFGTPTFYTVGSTSNTPTSLTTGYFSGTGGNLDVAVANTGDNTVSILLGNGSGALTVSGSPISVGHTPQAIRAGDFNGDSYYDLAVANYSDGTVTILLNNTSGGFTTSTISVGSGAHSGPQALAINGLGSSSLLAVANYLDNTVSVMRSNGSGGFGTQTIVPVGKGPDDVNFADFNGDNIPDLAVSNYTDGTVDLLLGSASGPYKLIGPFKVGNNPYSAAVGDINLDGTPDVVVSNCFSNNTGVLLDGTQIAVPYTGLSLNAANQYQGAYTPDSNSKYGSSVSPNTLP